MHSGQVVSSVVVECGPPLGGSSRDRQLDLLRGIAVAGMFFFSFVATLSDSLPTVLMHNVPDKVLIGDFVLSLFLFCSGISLAMLYDRHGSLRSLRLWRKLGTRLSQMVVVSIFVTPFSTNQILGMDEMMLNVVLTVPALVVLSVGSRWIWMVAISIWLTHTVLLRSGVIPEVPAEYLGGYRLAVVWLPILLGGTLAHARSQSALINQLLIWGALLLVAVVFSGWPDKMRLTASFGVLSVFLGSALLFILRHFNLMSSWLEYFGSKPLRMWILMFSLLGPIRLYAEVEYKKIVLDMLPPVAVFLSLAWMICCYWLSKIIDRMQLKQR
ncbi:MAG: heparan-alpha-glucosaminide N-acetyltransferase domain-containing protein [Pseudomonadota bacterium]|jgi:hypothetical protein